MKIQVFAEIEIPRLPNFVRYGKEDGQMLDVADISDADLQNIGEAWTSELIKHAQKRRKCREQESK